MAAAACSQGNLAAQFLAQAPVELTDAIRVDEPAPMVRTQLARVQVNINEQQWDEAIEGLRQLMENHGEHLVRLDARFISLREFAHLQLVKLPGDGRALYRGRVDAQAQRWYQDGVKNRDATLLARVVNELFASSYGDDALLALGEMALERGHYQRARECWERISPRLRAADGLPLWVEQRSDAGASEAVHASREAAADRDNSNRPVSWLAYPDTGLDLAGVRARLILVSLLEGALERAQVEYGSLIQLHPDAQGMLAGRTGPYAESLATLLKAAQDWPPPSAPKAATTFAGEAKRNFIAPGDFVLRSLAWSAPISLTDKPWQSSGETSQMFRLPAKRIAEDSLALLSYHPLAAGDLVIFHDPWRIYVYDLQTGRPAWPQAGAQTRPGQVYPLAPVDTRESSQSYTQTLGVSRFTATVHGSYLFVRLGSQITSWPEVRVFDSRDRLIVLDLSQQGKLIAEIQPENDRWSFEGPPVCDGARFYVAMRYNDVRPQAHVACYEIVSTSGSAGTTYTPRLRWRRMVCAAESPARGSEAEITHNLLTLAEGTLYLNTNLGAVASLAAADGRIHWLSTYPRTSDNNTKDHLLRDLNPCIYHRGTLYVAPTDSPQIFALDATTGLVRWASTAALADVVHLLGVAEGSLIASGRELWWLDAETGKVVISFPQSMEAPQAQPFGRGMLIGSVVVWPTRDRLWVFQQRQSPSTDANTLPAMPREPIRLADYHQQLSGGNLVAAGDYILLATPDKLWTFGPKLAEKSE